MTAPPVPGLVAALRLVFPPSPGYVLHQAEEHAGDRFRTVVGHPMFAGVDGLTTNGALWINLKGVWDINLAALFATDFLAPGRGLAAPYLMLVNALAHLAIGLRTCDYNAGLYAAILIFLPLAHLRLDLIQASLGLYVFGLGVSVGIRLLIAIGLNPRAAHLRQ